MMVNQFRLTHARVLAFTERRFVSERGMASPRQLAGQCTGQALTASRVNSVISNCTGRAVYRDKRAGQQGHWGAEVLADTSPDIAQATAGCHFTEV